MLHRVLLIVMFFTSSKLMASNPVVRSVFQGIELSNDHVVMVITHDATMGSCVDVKTGNDIAKHRYHKIVKVKTKNGRLLEADSVVLNGQTMIFFFDEERIALNINVYNDFFTFEVVEASSSNLYSITFMDLKFEYDFSDTHAFIATGLPMSLHTNAVHYPTGESKEVIGICMDHTGIIGAKIALICCYREELRTILKSVYNKIPSGSLPYTNLGGAYAFDNDVNNEDCIITNDGMPSFQEQQIDFYKEYNISQVDFEKGAGTFIQGDFSFPLVGSASEFKRRVADPLYKEGILSLLHTYSYYIDYNSIELLSDPHWQQQLEIRETFSLLSDISSNSTHLELDGDFSLFNKYDYWQYHTPFMLIGNEIVRYSLDKNGGIAFIRGQCGTRAVKHRAGETVRIIGGQFSCIAPIIGSELYYEIARRTAKAYNEGGFSGIYFDAFDGLPVHV